MGHISFNLDLREPARRQVRVTMAVDLAGLELPGSDSAGAFGFELFLATWTPGSYLVREYSRHLNDFQLGNNPGAGEMAWRKTAKNRFEIEVPAGVDHLDISYTVYCHELSVRTSDLTDQHGFLVGAELFLWPVGLGDSPVDLEVRLPESWDLATSLASERLGAGQFSLHATGLSELIDSPMLAGVLEHRQFTVLDRPHSFVLDGLVLSGDLGGDTTARPDSLGPSDLVPDDMVPDSLIRDTISIIEHAAAIFGGQLPYENYKFLAMFSDHGRGGLEHLSSSALLAPRTTFRPRSQYQEFLGLVAHEFFHVWNIKRMRPAELWEFDYEHENYTGLLWVAEGFTAYYDDHLCRRAGVLTPAEYLEIVGKGISELRRTPGRLHQSLTEASFDAWIRLYRPDEHTRNSTLSYYGNGALVAMCLDLRIRALTGGQKSLDEVMHQLYVQTFERGTGYTEASVIDVLNSVAGCELGDLVRSLVHCPLDPDFAELFEPFGLELKERTNDTPYLGLHLKANSTSIASIIEGSPADLGQLMPGDEILALAGLRVSSTLWIKVFDSVARTGQAIEVLLARRGRIIRQEVTPSPRPSDNWSVTVVEDSTAAQTAMRRAWLFELDTSKSLDDSRGQGGH